MFKDCTSLSSIDFGKTLTIIGGRLFENCTSLTEVTLNQDSEVELGTYMFADTPNLKKVELLGNTNLISTSTFSASSGGPKTVVFGKNVKDKYDGNGGLSSCQALENIIVDSDNPNFTAENGVLYNKNKTVLLCYPARKGGQVYNIPDSVQEIYMFCFKSNRYLQRIVCGENLKKIGDSMGYEAISLSIVEIPESVIEFGREALLDAAPTIWGKKGSTAQSYAEKNNLAFVDVDEYSGNTGKESTAGSSISDWDGKELEKITPVGNTYVVKTAAQLAWLAQQTSAGNTFACKKILLDADIDLAGYEWTPIGNNTTPFRGSFDGQGHTISNLTVTGSDTVTRCGLFGGLSAWHAGVDMVIENIHLESVNITGAEYGGGITGYARVYKGCNLTIRGCTVTGEISGQYAGGVAGQIIGGYANSRIMIDDIECECDVTASTNGGGIVGNVKQAGYQWASVGAIAGEVSIYGCTNDGTIQGTGTYGTVGGILGKSENLDRGRLYIERCRADGKVDASSYVYLGGITSEITGSQNYIQDCVNYASVNGGYYTGGIVGHVDSNVSVERCCNEGYIQVKRDSCTLGGIVGKNDGTIRDCYNTGRIGGQDVTYNGGITGSNGGTLENCYSIGKLPDRGSGTSFVSLPGAMSMLFGGTTKYCFFDRSVDSETLLYGSGMPVDTQDVINDSENNIEYSGGLTTGQMKSASSYVVWDFENIWEFDSDYGYGYPILRDIKYLLKQRPENPESDVDEVDVFRFTVVDQDGEAIDNAVVTCGEETKQTQEGGIVKFYYNNQAMKLSVSKEGYISYTDDAYLMNDTLENTIRLISESKEEDFALNSVVLLWNGHRYELLTQTKEINKKFQDVTATLFCQPVVDASEVEKYSLYQGEQLIQESSTGNFVLKMGDLIETKFGGKVRKSRIVVTLKNGTTREDEINLDVVDEDSNTSQMEFGDNLTFTVGDDVPLLGGSTITVETMKLPVVYTVSEEKWKISLNIWEKDMGEAGEIFKSELTATKKLDKLKKYLKEGELESIKNPKVSFEVVGYGEGDMPMTGNQISMKIYVKMSVTAGWEVQACPGIVFAVDIKGTAKASGGIDWDIKNSTLDGKVKVEAGIGISAYLGVGVAQVASAGVYGTGSFNLAFYLLPLAKTGLDEMYLEADLKAVIRFMRGN